MAIGDPVGVADGVVTVDAHLRRILTDVQELPHHHTPLLEALDLACAEDVVAPMSLPSFDNSSMDGYAVRTADLAGVSDATPVTLPVVGEIGAGQARLIALAPGTAAKIMTGAPVPAGADAVVPYEWTDRGTSRVQVRHAPESGQYVRAIGDDVSEGDLLVGAGTTLTPRHIGLLAAVGRATVASRARPRVVVLSTGSELRDPGRPVGHDSIYDGNSYMLAAEVRRAGGVPYRVGIVPDRREEFLAALQDQLVRADAVVTSGGVSQGDFDVVKESLAPQGVWFGPVAMQPGRPQGYGRVGDDRVPVFALPGNPVSSYISFQVFVLPALRKMMGKTPYSRPTVTARLTHRVTSPEGKRQFLRGDAHADTLGPYVSPVGGPGSHLLGDLANANCLIVVPEDVAAIEANEKVRLLLLDEDF